MSRLELLEFLEYLREKDDVIIESQIIHYRTLFNRHTADKGIYARYLLKVIKKARSAEEAYRMVAHEKAKQNSLWKTFPEGGYMFREDFEELLEQEPEMGNDPVIIKWRVNGTLETREVIKEYFPTEYVNFIFRLFDQSEGDAAVISYSNKGAFNYYRSEKDKIRKAEKDTGVTVTKRITIGYSGEDAGADIEKMITVAKFICGHLGIDAVNIADYDRDDVICVTGKNV